MRVTSSFFVSALVRRCNDAGLAAMVVRRGAGEAGAIFLMVDRLNGESDLYAPAPQAMLDEDETGGRHFQCISVRASAMAITERLDKERNFDPDLWVVAIEDRQGRTFFDTV